MGAVGALGRIALDRCRLCPHISGSRIKLWGSWKGFPGNKQLRGPVHLNGPPWFSSPHHKIQPEFLCQMLVIVVFLARHRVQGHFHHVSTAQSLPHFARTPTFLTPSIARAQGTVWLRMMHVTKKWGVFTCQEICLLTMGIWLEVSKVILKSSIPAITEGDASHVP